MNYRERINQFAVRSSEKLKDQLKDPETRSLLNKLNLGGKELVQSIRRNTAQETLALSRGACYGAAAICLAILLSLVSFENKDVALYLSVFFSSLSLPLWIALGFVHEQYYFLGKIGYGHMHEESVVKKGMKILLAAIAGLYCAVATIIWHLMPAAIIGFFIASAIATKAVLQWTIHLVHWIGEKELEAPLKTQPAAEQ